MLEREHAPPPSEASLDPVAAPAAAVRHEILQLQPSRSAVYSDLRNELARTRTQAEQAAEFVTTSGLAAVVSAGVAALRILLNERPGASGMYHSPDAAYLQRVELLLYVGLVILGVGLSTAVWAYCVKAAGLPGAPLQPALRRWSDLLRSRTILPALIDPVHLERLGRLERDNLRWASHLAPDRQTFLAQLRFVARHASGLQRCGGAPEALDRWHFIRLWLLQFVEPLLGTAGSWLIVLGTAVMLLYGWAGHEALLAALPVVLTGLLALGRERLESRAALHAIIENLLA